MKFLAFAALVIASFSLPVHAESAPKIESYATAWGAVVWAKTNCPDIKIDVHEAYLKIRLMGMSDKEFDSGYMKDEVLIVMLELEKVGPFSCEFILREYGPQGRTVPGLVED